MNWSEPITIKRIGTGDTFIPGVNVIRLKSHADQIWNKKQILMGEMLFLSLTESLSVSFSFSSSAVLTRQIFRSKS